MKLIFNINIKYNVLVKVMKFNTRFYKLSYIITLYVLFLLDYTQNDHYEIINYFFRII
jgi:hypothetical protein